MRRQTPRVEQGPLRNSDWIAQLPDRRIRVQCSTLVAEEVVIYFGGACYRYASVGDTIELFACDDSTHIVATLRRHRNQEAAGQPQEGQQMWTVAGLYDGNQPAIFTSSTQAAIAAAVSVCYDGGSLPPL